MLFLNNDYIFNAKRNLALEEALFRSPDINEDLLYLWQNANAVIIGKNQITANEINESYVRQNNIQVVRRVTGGGAVYHDLGNLNFTLITRNRSKIKAILFDIIEALKSFNLNLNPSGRNDLYLNNYKVSGTAQAASQNKILFHGTLLIESDLNRLTKALTVNKKKLYKHGIKSVKARVENLKNLCINPIDVQSVKQSIIQSTESMFKLEDLPLDQKLINRAERLYNKRYSQNSWNYNKLKEYEIIRDYSFDNGYIQLAYNLFNGSIENLSLSGDFFSNRDITILQNQLNGIKLTNLEETLQNIEIKQFINGLTKKEFLKLFRGD